MKNATIVLTGATALLFAGCSQQQGYVKPPETAQGDIVMSEASVSAGNPQTREEKIENAESAGPKEIAQGAGILDWPAEEGGNFVELRPSVNGWTCLPDIPTSPSNDPICVDENAMLWFQAYLKKETPHITQAGISYMLQGGGDASNTDPFATEPAEGETWMLAPPHIMVFPTGDLDPDVYGTDINGGPWIMWSGTPYEHLMIPVE